MTAVKPLGHVSHKRQPHIQNKGAKEMDKRNPHTGGAGVTVNLAADATPSKAQGAKRQTLSLRYDRSYTIIVRPAGGGFEVAIEPLFEPYGAPKLYADYRSARGAAGGLRLVNRWQIDDQCGDRR